MSRLHLCFACILLVAAAGFPAFSGTISASGVGVSTLRLTDPAGGGPMEAALFYPASRPTGASLIGSSYRIDAEPEAPLQDGPHPLILLSHGHEGSRWGHHDLAEHLALQGFVVAAIEHPGDNYRDQSGIGTDRVLLGRATQISALLSGVLADTRFGPAIDRDRIGVAGFSAGGYTSLLLVGANPDFDLIHPYCRRHPLDGELCGFLGLFRRIPANPEKGALRDSRIRAAFVMAPLAIFFDQQALAAIEVPVFLVYAGDDRVLIPGENGARIMPFLGSIAGYRVVAGADHYVFLAPCPLEQKARRPEICADPPGVDREKVHRTINGDAVSFFSRALPE